MPSIPLAQFADGLSARDADRAKALDSALQQVEAQLTSLRRDQRRLLTERQALVDQGLRTLERQAGKQRNARAVDYNQPFDDRGTLVRQVAAHFWPGFQQFRYCQEGVVRAVLDRRHVFVVMPTGGGKSFCYQLPALFQAGVTLVISPLVSLMHDQVLHLRQQGIPCELLTAAVPREDKTRINRLVRSMTRDNNLPIVTKTGRVTEREEHEDQPPKLLYVTPEQLTKNKTLRASLQSAEEAGALARIVVDEAHCCSQYGHDFRPDYRKLDLLTKFFTHTPLSCFTATAPYAVVKDVIECLGLPQLTSADQSVPNETVHFTSPLIRDNLAYAVLPKNTGKDEYTDVVNYILRHHEGETGIVYCLSQKNSEDMAKHLSQLSDGVIRARAYHAGMLNEDKERTHQRWMSGQVHVICATTAFGMGIDKANVRFVLHATMPTSIEGLYQESGRAGRDGQASDCVLFYRPQDGVRISSVASDSPGGSNKVRAILEYAQTLGCRKVFFARYFEDEHSDYQDCGSCDNCSGTEMALRDLSIEAWKCLHALARIKLDHGRITLGQLTDLVRGNNKGRYEVVGNGERVSAPNAAVTGVNPPGSFSKVGNLNMDDFGGKVILTKGNTERLLVDLWTRGHIREEYVQTPHTVNVYLDLSIESWTLRKMSWEQVHQMVRMESGTNDRVLVSISGKDLETTVSRPNDKGPAKSTESRLNKPSTKAKSSTTSGSTSRSNNAPAGPSSATVIFSDDDGTTHPEEVDSSDSESALSSVNLRKRPVPAETSTSTRKSRRVQVLDSSSDESA